MIHCYAERSTDGILTTITLTNTVFFIILTVEMEFQSIDDLTSLFRQTVFLHQRHYSQFHRSQSSRQFQYNAALTIFQLFFAISCTHDTEEHAVHANWSLDHIRSIRLVQFRIEIFDALSWELLMLRQVKVRTWVDTFHFLEAEWHQEFNICSSICIVSQFIMIVVTIAGISKA